jgi:hypothetical protein
VVDEDAVAARREIERNVLVRLLAAGPSVRLPHVDDLAVLDVRGEAFAQAVDGFADSEAELGEHVVAAVLDGGEGGALVSGGGQQVAVRIQELQAEGTLREQPQGEGAGGQFGGPALRTCGGGSRAGRARQGEVGPGVPLAREVGDPHADDTFGGRVRLHRDQGRVEGVTAPFDALDGGVGGETVGAELEVADFGGVRGVHTVSHLPEAVGELHGGLP